jgi:hypothetical protein
MKEGLVNAACTARGMFRWALILLCFGAVAGGMVIHSVWNKADHFLRAEIEKQIAERVPDWDVTFRQAHADLNGTIRVLDVLVRPNKDADTIVEIPEVVLHADMNLVFEHQKVAIQRVHVKSPTIYLDCDSAGHWNWQDLSRPRPKDSAPPDIVVEDATVAIHMERSSQWPATDLRVSSLRLTAEPSSRHGFLFAVGADLQQVGHIDASGETDFTHGAWKIDGRCGKVDLEGLVQSAIGFSPNARGHIAVATAANRNDRPRHEFQLASTDGEAAPPVQTAAAPPSKGVLSGMGLQADMSLEFHASAKAKGEPPQYTVSADIRDGQITNRILPLPLYGLKGHVAVESNRLVVKSLTASNGESQVLLDGRWDFSGAKPQRRMVCQISELQLGPELRAYLPAVAQARYDQLQPTGRFNIDIEYDANLSPLPLKLREFTVSNGSCRHELFPMAVTGIEGTIRQDENRFNLNFHGVTGSRKVSLDGAMLGVTPDAELKLLIHVDDLPIDTAFLQAFAKSKLEKLQKLYPVLVSLGGSGSADWRVELDRPPGPNQKFRLSKVRGVVSNGELRYTRFPLDLAELHGLIDFDHAAGNIWNFRDLRAIHGEAKISGQGSYSLVEPPGVLDLQITALGAVLDADLKHATVTASAGMDTAWKELNPSGTLDINNLRILWSPGSPVDVSIPSIQFRDARIVPAAVPYPWEKLNGAARWSDHRLVIHTLQGWHGDTYLNVSGADPETADGAATAYFEQTGETPEAWRLHLGDVQMRKLVVDDELRGALRTSLRAVATHVAPTEPIDVAFALDLKGGSKTDPVTAAWRFIAALPGGDANLGIAIQKVRGTIEMSHGTYDGQDVHGAGLVAFDQAVILGQPVTDVRGPFRIDGSRIVVGAPTWLKLPPVDEDQDSSIAGNPLTARVYGGKLIVDAVADVLAINPAESPFRVETRLRNADLAEWARANQFRERLKGEVQGEINLSGVGALATGYKGNGWVQVSPAQLYDLPVMVKILQLFKLTAPDSEAFEYAYGEFGIAEGVFDFSRIELLGKTLSLLGKGWVGFAGSAAQTLNIDLYTRVTSPLSKVPLVGFVADQIGKNWVGIHVVGTVSSPQAVVQGRIPLLDDTLKGFMGAMQKGQARQPPRPVNP